MRKIFILAILILLIIYSVSAYAKKEDIGMEEITGVPTVYGIEPHTYVCIQAETGKVYYVHPDNQKRIEGLDRYNYIFTIKFVEGPAVSLDASYHKDGTVRVFLWKKVD